MATSRKPGDAGFVFPDAEALKASAQQIWLAGLGAFAKAQQEGGKVFDTLVKDGLEAQRKTQSTTGQSLGEAGARMASMAQEFGARAAGSFDKLENLFEQRVAKALAQLHVPTAAEFAELQARVAALEAAAPRPAPTAKKTRASAPASARPRAARKPRAE